MALLGIAWCIVCMLDIWVWSLLPDEEDWWCPPFFNSGH